MLTESVQNDLGWGHRNEYHEEDGSYKERVNLD